jgi:hypothetical protein
VKYFGSCLSFSFFTHYLSIILPIQAWLPKYSCKSPSHRKPSSQSDSQHSTGATGYIGGDGLFAIASAHPDWQFSALVRSQEKAAQVTSKYPQIRTVIGDLDSSDLIEEEVKNADIVFRMFTEAPYLRCISTGLTFNL